MIVGSIVGVAYCSIISSLPGWEALRLLRSDVLYQYTLALKNMVCNRSAGLQLPTGGIYAR